MGKKKQITGHISEAISLTDFILGTKVQPNKAHSLTQVTMTLTQGQGQRSRSNFLKKIIHISNSIEPTNITSISNDKNESDLDGR